jgi:hypothetical protein
MLKSIDLFGIPVVMSVRDSSSYKSFMGGLLTIFMIFLGIMAFVAFGRDLIEKKVPTVLGQKSLNTAPYFMVDKNFTMMFALLDKDSFALPDQDRTFKITLQAGNVNQSRNNDSAGTA